MFEVNNLIWKNALTIVTSSEPLNIRCHVIVTQQRSTVERCARKFRSVSAIRVNKVFLQELNKLIGIKMLTSDFQNIFGS